MINKTDFKFNKGFSLVEILISISILVVFVVAISVTLTNINKQLISSNRKEKAIILAEELVEKARNTRNIDFNSLADYSDTIDNLYERDMVVTVPNILYPDQKKVNVLVSWPDSFSNTNSVSMTTYLTNWKVPMPETGLVIRKNVINHGGIKGQDDFAPYLVEGYFLNNETDPPTEELKTIEITPSFDSIYLTPGTYTISEKIDTDYNQTFSGDCDINGVVTIGVGESKECIITNEEKINSGSIFFKKVVVNHGLNKTVNDFGPYVINTNPTINLVPDSSNIVQPGSWKISELLDSNYNQAFSGDCDSSGNISILNGQSKTCTITNEEKLSYLTINKNLINHGLTKVVSDFAPFKAGTFSFNFGVKSNIDSGSYVVSETEDSRYKKTFSGDCSSDGSLLINSGDDKVCNITNEENPLGLIIYGDGSSMPKSRDYYRDNSFSAEKNTLYSSTGRVFEIKTSPTKREAIAAYVDPYGTLQVFCYDGESWSNDWGGYVGGNGTTRRFDIEYETNSGDAIIVYSNNSSTNNELAYRVKSGSSSCGVSSWSSQNNLDTVSTSGVVHWVKMARDRRSSSDLITAIWADSNADLSAKIWNGSSFVNEPAAALETSLENISVGQDTESFDVEYESLSGDVMIVFGNKAGTNAVNGVRYVTCTGGTFSCYWGSKTTPPTFLDDATDLDISANPNTDEMVFASIGNAGSDLQVGYWSGSSWTNTANRDTACALPVAGSKILTTGWLNSGATKRSVVIYHDSGTTNVGWYVGSGGTFTAQTDFTPSPAFALNQKWYRVDVDPINKNNLIFTISDGANDLFAKRLIMTSTPAFTWSNIGSALTTILPQNISNPFSFSFWNN